MNVVDSPREKPAAKRVVGVILAALVLVLSLVFPECSSLSRQGMAALGVLLSCTFLWFTEALPAGIVGLYGVLMLTVTGACSSISESLSGFTNGTVWFVLAVFCLSISMSKSSLGQRLACRLLCWAKTDSRKIVLAWIVIASVLSSVMTDVGTVMMLMGLAIPFMNSIGIRKKESSLGKCIMLGIAFGSILGGFATPAGNVLNVMCIGVLESNLGITISFLDWMVVGVPVCLLGIPCVWMSLLVGFKPEEIPSECIDQVGWMGEGIGPWSFRDKVTFAVVILLPLLWVAGNWLPALSSTVIILAGLVLMFCPFVDLISWNDFKEQAGWEAFLMVGSVMCLGNAVQSTGGGDLLASLLVGSGIANLPPLLALLICAVFLYIVHTFCPIAVALAVLVTPPFITCAQMMGIPVQLPVFVVGAIVAGSFLVPLNPTIIANYSAGYYSFGEVARGGWLAAILYIAVVVLWVYFVGGAYFG